MTTYRTYVPSDRAAVDDLLIAAFGGHGAVVTRMVEDIRAGGHYTPAYEIVAVEGDRIVGHVLLSGTTICGARGGIREVLQLTPLSTAPDRQRQGIGTTLIQRAVAVAEQAGEPLVLLEGSPGFYGRRGFEPAERHGIRYPLPSWAPAEAAQVLLLRGYDAADPTLRGRVVPPDHMPDPG